MQDSASGVIHITWCPPPHLPIRAVHMQTVCLAASGESTRPEWSDQTSDYKLMTLAEEIGNTLFPLKCPISGINIYSLYGLLWNRNLTLGFNRNKSDGEKLISNDMFSVSESICSWIIQTLQLLNYADRWMFQYNFYSNFEIIMSLCKIIPSPSMWGNNLLLVNRERQRGLGYQF